MTADGVSSCWTIAVNDTTRERTNLVHRLYGLREDPARVLWSTDTLFLRQGDVTQEVIGLRKGHRRWVGERVTFIGNP